MNIRPRTKAARKDYILWFAFFSALFCFAGQLRAYEIIIWGNQPPVPGQPIINGPLYDTGYYGKPFIHTFTIQNRPTGKFAAKGLPKGLKAQLIDGKASIQGTPLQAGSFMLTLGAANSRASYTTVFHLTIQAAPVTFRFDKTTANYDGAPHSVTVTTSPSQVPFKVLYDQVTTPPSAVGSYTVDVSSNSPNYTGHASATLTILPALPTAMTLSSASITATSAILGGSANPKNSDTLVSFQYGFTSSYGNSSAPQDIGGGSATKNFSGAVTSLSPSTLYHYRAVSTNAGGTVYGGDKTFSTLSVPTIGTLPQVALGASRAEINLSANPNGSATQFYFEYGVTNTYGQTTAVQNLGGGKAQVNVFLLFPSLLANTTYHYRWVMAGPAGTFKGTDRTFTTLGFETTLVVQKGADVDLAGVTSKFTSFGPPAINAADTTAFLGIIDPGPGVTSSSGTGIWTIDDAGMQQLVAKEGDSASISNSVFDSFSDPLINDNGDVAFKATLRTGLGSVTTSNATGIWTNTGGTLHLIARQGDTAGGTAGKFATFVSLGFTDTAGSVVFATLANDKVAGISAANNAGIWEGTSSQTFLPVLRLGQTVGDKTITTLTFQPAEIYVNGQARNFSPHLGYILAGATFSDKSTGLVKVAGGSPMIVAATGLAAADIAGATFTSFRSGAINDAAGTAFVATLTPKTGGTTTTNNVGIWADDPAQTRHLIARTGTGSAPGTIASFTAFSDPLYNHNAAVCFRATLKVGSGQATNSNAIGIWATDGTPASLALVARQGDQAPGCPAGSTFANFTELALPDQGGANNKGGVIFVATLNSNATAGVTTANNTGIWAVDNAGSVRLIARTGDLINVGSADYRTVSSLTFLPSPTVINGTNRGVAQANGDLVYLATFSDKSTAILNVTF